jgi:hypothetical protein
MYPLERTYSVKLVSIDRVTCYHFYSLLAKSYMIRKQTVDGWTDGRVEWQPGAAAERSCCCYSICAYLRLYLKCLSSRWGVGLLLRGGGSRRR